MKRETNTPKPHIVLCAPKKTGKTTLIERIMQETKAPTDEPPIPVYGFQTKRIACSDGVNRIYMFPAGHVQTYLLSGQHLRPCERCLYRDLRNLRHCSDPFSPPRWSHHHG